MLTIAYQRAFDTISICFWYHQGLTFPPFLRPVIFTGGDIGKLTDKKGLGSGDSFRVLLIDDARHTETLGNDLFFFSEKGSI